MSTARCQEVQITTCPATAACWQDEGAEIRSLVSRRVFQIQVDAEGVVRCLCRENDNVREVLVADVIGDARDSASLLRTQARDEAYARVGSLLRRGLGCLLAAIRSGVAGPVRVPTAARLSRRPWEA
jgi:hypothetical protein